MEEQFLDILRGKTSPGERVHFFKRLQDNPVEKQTYMSFEKLWVLNQLKYRNSGIQNKKKHFKHFWQRRKPEIRMKAWKMAVSIAAFIILSLLVATSVFITHRNSAPDTIVLMSPKGNVSQMTLDDGSRVWLNSESSIELKKLGAKRVVVNLKGEAFFEVIHNPSREFIVQVGDYVVKDIGTQFNVDFDVDDKQINVALFEGAIEFKKGQKELYPNLQPGRMICYNMDSQILLEKAADRSFITAWKDGKFVFVNQTMEEIARELEDWYDVKFVFENPSIKDDAFFGVIRRRTSLEHILSVLRLSAEIDYSIKEQEDGSLVVIFK